MMKKDFSYGVIPIYKDRDGKFSVLIIKQADSHSGPSAGFWGFPKGHRDEGETETDAAKRELSEEAGIESCTIVADAEFVDKYIYTFEGIEIDKTVTFYPAFVESKTAHLESDHNKEHIESVDLKWIDPKELSEYLLFANQNMMAQKIIDWLQSCR